MDILISISATCIPSLHCVRYDSKTASSRDKQHHHQFSASQSDWFSLPICYLGTCYCTPCAASWGQGTGVWNLSIDIPLKIHEALLNRRPLIIWDEGQEKQSELKVVSPGPSKSFLSELPETFDLRSEPRIVV
ncbi:unnamed protein product [Larinioides sclopetarius]|uniref:Uncharacterized protein n=1 Tax=Larinioides sclopetarius TaxID=280406 RepID=A0AAV2ANU8_9ARAC